MYSAFMRWRDRLPRPAVRGDRAGPGSEGSVRATLEPIEPKHAPPSPLRHFCWRGAGTIAPRMRRPARFARSRGYPRAAKPRCDHIRMLCTQCESWGDLSRASTARSPRCSPSAFTNGSMGFGLLPTSARSRVQGGTGTAPGSASLVTKQHGDRLPYMCTVLYRRSRFETTGVRQAGCPRP